ncbi:unnamed protein product [Rotaria magnacalcarata]|uniref:Uncharacterized protein n=1 Tax=Rotaria magnacalcarata TaxID=392030 RepID=A0A816Z5K5_9BILA|nr:unnamed protein product [Rotaria magnacalcarata]
MIDFVFARTKVAFDLALVLFITNQDIGEENLNEWNNDNTGENNNLLQTTMEYVVQRPPRPPACRMRPYLQFVTTDLENKLWIGSILIFQHISYRRPTIEFTAEVKIAYD